MPLNAPPASRSSPPPAQSQPVGDDERSLLIRLELLLEREEALLAARDVDGIAGVADEREQLVERLGAAARKRRAEPGRGEEPELVALYRRLRQRHDTRAQVIRRHVERNACALGVFAQATGQAGLYGADGNVKLKFVTF